MTELLTGRSLVAGRPVEGTQGTFRAVDPSTGQPLEPVFGMVGDVEVELATQAAADAFDDYRGRSPLERADFLDRIAAEIESIQGDLVLRAGAETGLPAARLQSECARTTGQLRMFADVVRRGDAHEVRVDPAQPERRPLPRPDLRQVHVPVGPVAVFGPSNFPLAFSTAGGDTASALAAGCPVVVKAHHAHPGTAELVAQAVTTAVTESGLAPGVFSQLYGSGAQLGQALVADPRIKAVGFTGSRAAGTALMRTAAARPVPIPVYAEMSSINPVVVLPGALGDPASLAEAYIGSLTLGAGQFCTNPGLLFVPSSAAGDAFVEAAAALVDAGRGQAMLTAGIAQSCRDEAAALAGRAGMAVVAKGAAGDGPNAPAPMLLTATASTFLATPEMSDEVFGAVGLIVRYDDQQQLRAALSSLDGQLTASIHHGAADVDATRALLPLLEQKVGRIVFGGWPTGVEVTHAMVHGGPFPATSDGRSTSVGSLAIRRFLRPVCYQSAPEELLPPSLRPDNPWGLPRRVDGIVHG